MFSVKVLNSCPYEIYRPETLSFCEAHLCSYIKTPAEAWSNLAYIVVGLVVLKIFYQDHKLKKFGIIAILVGINSFIYHATHRYWTETLDLATMNLLGALLVTLNLERMGFVIKKVRLQIANFCMILFSSFILLLLEGKDRLLVFTFFVVAFLILELMIAKKCKQQGQLQRNYFWLWQSLILFAAAFIAWNLDFYKIVCDPDNHFISGHAMWHILNAGCFFTLAKFFHQPTKLTK